MRYPSEQLKEAVRFIKGRLQVWDDPPGVEGEVYRNDVTFLLETVDESFQVINLLLQIVEQHQKYFESMSNDLGEIVGLLGVDECLS